MTSPQHLELELPGITLRALTWGSPNDPLVLCLHGFPDTAWTWRHLGPKLASRGKYVVAPFTRGYGPSDIPSDGDYHMAALMHDAIEVCRVLGAGEASIVGHDWGAATANALAAYPDSPFTRTVSAAFPPLSALRPQRVTDIVQLPLLLGRQSMMSWYIGFNQLPFAPERLSNRLFSALWERWSPGYDATEDLALLADSMPAIAHKQAALGYYRAMVRPRISKRYQGLQKYALARPRRPMLYLHGENDGCVTHDFVERIIATLPDGSEVERISGVGHFLHLEQPDVVNAQIIEYLAGD